MQKSSFHGAYHYMDMMRAVAAMAVVLNHSRDIFIRPDGMGSTFDAMTSAGHSAVIVFFVLSGFWITKSVDSKIEDKNFWINYVIDRGSRIYVALLPALFIGILLDNLGLMFVNSDFYLNGNGSASLQHEMEKALSVPTFVMNLAFLVGIKATTYGSNTALWSLSQEVWFYIFFPGLLLAFRKRRLTLALLLMLAICAYRPAFAAGFLCWLCGSAAYYLHRRVPAGLGSASPWLKGVFLVLFALPFAGCVLLVRSKVFGQPALNDLSLALTFALFLIALCAVNPTARLAKLAEFGQHSSYTLYVTHLPLVTFVAAFVVPQARLSYNEGSIALVLALTASCVILSAALSRLTEDNTKFVRDSLRSRFTRRPLAET